MNIDRKPMHRIEQGSVLVLFGNTDNMQTLSGAENIYRIIFDNGQAYKIQLEEVISKYSETHILELSSSRWAMESGLRKHQESAIHHHPKKGHQGYHLQFKIVLDKVRTLRVMLDKLDRDDYNRCIRGFLFASKKIIKNECKLDKMTDLTTFFFKKNIKELEPDYLFLKSKVLQSQILGEKDIELPKKDLIDLKKNPHLLPFFNR